MNKPPNQALQPRAQLSRSVLSHGSRQLRSWLIFNVRRESATHTEVFRTMKSNRLPIAALWMAWLMTIAGCARKPMTYEEAHPRFSAGMSKADIQAMFGVPKVQDTASWLYVPLDRLSGGPGVINGFEIRFRGSVATEIVRVPYTSK